MCLLEVAESPSEHKAKTQPLPLTSCANLGKSLEHPEIVYSSAKWTHNTCKPPADLHRGWSQSCEKMYVAESWRAALFLQMLSAKAASGRQPPSLPPLEVPARPLNSWATSCFYKNKWAWILTLPSNIHAQLRPGTQGSFWTIGWGCCLRSGWTIQEVTLT